MRSPHFDAQHREKELVLLKKKKPRLFSSQDVEDMQAASIRMQMGLPTTRNPFPANKAGMIVLEKQPDEDKRDLPKPKDRKAPSSGPQIMRAPHPVAQFTMRRRGHGLDPAALAGGPRTPAIS